MVGLDFLEKIDIFKELNDDQLTAVLDCCQEAEYGRDVEIFNSKDDPIYLYIVIAGEVVLRQDQPSSHQGLENRVITTISETKLFGWSSLVPPFKYRLSAYCSSRTCKVLKIERNCLVKLLEGDFHMGYKVISGILAVVGTRFHQLREEIIRILGQDIMNQW